MPFSGGGEARLRENIEIEVEKPGREIKPVHSRAEQAGLSVDSFPTSSKPNPQVIGQSFLEPQNNHLMTN
jgi:hypothetical protein